MPRRAGGRGRRQIVPGVAALVRQRFAFLNDGFCRKPNGQPCWWCAVVADLDAGRPVEMDGATLHDALCARDDRLRFQDLRGDERAWLVHGDGIELAPTD